MSSNIPILIAIFLKRIPDLKSEKHSFILFFKTLSCFFTFRSKLDLSLLCGKLLHSCPTLCNPVDCGPPGSSVHGILQTRILGWVAMPSSRVSSQPRDRPVSLMSPALASRFFTTSTTWKAQT